MMFFEIACHLFDTLVIFNHGPQTLGNSKDNDVSLEGKEADHKIITKTCLLKYIENFITKKRKIFR